MLRSELCCCVTEEKTSGNKSLSKWLILMLLNQCYECNGVKIFEHVSINISPAFMFRLG